MDNKMNNGKMDHTTEKESNGDKKELKRSKRKKEKDLVLELRELNVDDVKCGIGSCKPAWLQRFASMEMYLVVYCIVGLSIGMYFTYSVSTISTIEKRFKMTSRHTGLMLTGNDISQVLIAILVSYFGNYGNRPMLMAAGIWSASLACLLAALPHAIYGPGEEALAIQEAAINFNNDLFNSSTLKGSSSKTVDLCYDAYQEDCENLIAGESATLIGPVVILFISQMLLGVTISVFYSIGMVYLDDNVKKKQSPVYYSISMIVRVVGPVLGFFLGSKCLSIYVIPDVDPNLSLRDPRWLGAWWLGYAFLSILLFFCGSFLFLFPRTLPVTMVKKLRKVHHEEHNKEKEEKKSTNDLLLYEEQPAESASKRDLRLSFCETDFELNRNSDLRYYLELAKVKERFTKPALSKLPAALKRLMSNKVFLGTNFNTVLVLFALMGYWSFKPKYLEFQFGKSASTANFYTGLASIISSVFGLAISGIIVKVFRPGPRMVTAYAAGLTLFGSVCMFSLMFIGCPQVDINGPSTWTLQNSTSSSCMQDCGCSDRYAPVCSEDGVTAFYSACYAGCTIQNSSASPVHYSNCSCIQNTLKNTKDIYTFAMDSNETENLSDDVYVANYAEEGGEATQGYCESNCNAFTYYIILTTISKLIDSTGRIGSTLVYLRSVEEQDKALALGMTTAFISFFAFIPAPIIMGIIIDSTCIIWDNTCGQKGNCWLYDSEKFKILIHTIPACLILLSAIGDFIVFANSNHILLYGEDEEYKTPDTEKSPVEMNTLMKTETEKEIDPK